MTGNHPLQKTRSQTLKRLCTQSGQGMIGVLVSSGLLIIMIGAILQVLNGAMKGQQGSSQTSAFSAFTVELARIVSDSNYCNTALLNQPVYSATVTCDTSQVTTVNIEGREFLKTNTVKNGLNITKLCIQRVHNNWNFEDTTRLPVKLVFEATKTDGATGKQLLYEEFFFNVKTDTGTPPLITSCIDYFQATPVPIPTPLPCIDPVVGTLTHAPRSKNFTVSWTAGRCNGGENGCEILYQRPNDGVWVRIGPANCDLPATNAAYSLPGEGWNEIAPTTPPWNVPVRLRLVENPTVKFWNFTNQLTCPSAVAAVGAPTNNIDENCNSIWSDDP